MTAALDSFRRYVNPHRVEGFESLGWADTFVQASGSQITSSEGRSWLDFCAGFGAATLGHHHPRLHDALREFSTERPPGIVPFGVGGRVGLLAARLCALAGGALQKVYFGNSGAEGIEAALKFAMFTTGRSRFIAFEGGYHGLTLGALATAGAKFWTSNLPNHGAVACSVLPFVDLEGVEHAVAEDNVAGIVLEVVQGCGGARSVERAVLEQLQVLARRHGTLLIIDEVLTGAGRTGLWFAHHDAQVAPDIVVLSKGLTGGVVPLSAVLVTDQVFNAVYGGPGCASIHGSTFSGNALACSIALAVLDTVEEENLVEAAASKGRQLTAALSAMSTRGLPIQAVHGRGLLIGVQIFDPEQQGAALELCLELRRRGVIVALAAHAPSVIKLTPPLNVEARAVETFLEVFEASVHALCS